MKKFLVILLLSTASLFSQVNPTTVLQATAQEWNDGTKVLTADVGPTLITNGATWAYTVSNANLNNRASLRPQGTADSLTWAGVLNADTSNYVVFAVHQTTTNVSATLLDVRTASAYHLIIPTGLSASLGNGYYYGLSSQNAVGELVDTTQTWRIRCWVFERDSGKFYVNGGIERLTGVWEPAPLSIAGARHRFISMSSASADFEMAHFSIHKMASTDRANVTWINNFGDSLATYYVDTGIWWTDIIGGYFIHTPVEGAVYQEGDTLVVDYDNQTGDDTTYVWLSQDNGTNYIFIGASADTLLNYIIDGLVFSEQNIIRVGTSDSTDITDSDLFIILPASQIEILYPIEQTRTFTYGDTAQVKVRSIFCNELWYSFSNDSATWYLIDSVLVDTTNGSYWDTTDVVWTFQPPISGPKIWLKVEQYADTTIYDIETDFIDIGDMLPLDNNSICQDEQSGTLLERQFIYDVSCGWASPPWRYYNAWLDSTGLSYHVDYNVCNSPYTGCTYPTLDPVYLVGAVDTTETPLISFYTTGTTVTYNNRLYYVSSQILYSNDLVNGIDSLVVADLSEFYAQVGPDWVEGNEDFLVYDIEWTRLSGEYVDSAASYTSLNDDEFIPLLIVGQDGYPWEAVAIPLLGVPPIGDAAIDIEIAYTSSTVTRGKFRGIHPKAEKRN